MINIKKFLKITAASAAIAILASGCYRMPNEDDYSLIPTTNNPDVVGSHNQGLIPGGKI